MTDNINFKHTDGFQKEADGFHSRNFIFCFYFESAIEHWINEIKLQFEHIFSFHELPLIVLVYLFACLFFTNI